MKIKAVAVILTSLVLYTGESVFAQDEPDYGWSGTGEFGLVMTSGNTDTTSVNLAMNFKYEVEKWRHEFGAAYLNADNDGDKTANRYDLRAQSSYKVTEKSYYFGALRHDNDDFSAYQNQTTLTAGYGRQILDSERHKLVAEIGAGYRTAELANTGETEKGVVGRGLVDWLWVLTGNTELTDRFLVEAGSDNTYLQNDLGLSVAMNDKFAIKLGFQVRHNTDVPEDVKKTDTITSANLVYNF
jgi:putative salt-induced outer membrane protein